MQKIHVCPWVTSLVVVVALYAVPAMAQIEINDIDELQLIGNDPGYPLDGDYVLGNDIDASATAGWNGGEGFIPIAPDTDPLTGGHQGTKFTGSFDGQGYTITNLTVNRPTADYLGLFGYLDSAIIRNVALENVDVSGDDYVGGLVGYFGDYTSITSSYSTGAVSGDGCVGGLVGLGQAGSFEGASIVDCYSTSTVSGVFQVGGLVGAAEENNDITNCYSTGAVSGGWQVGGLVGLKVGGITHCYSTSAVSGNNTVGGLVGELSSYSLDESITDSYSTGAVLGSSTVGGLVGNASFYVSITSSYSVSNVTGDSTVGGLVGYVDNETTITSSYSTGTVSGTDTIGGLVGKVRLGNITDSYSISDVSGDSTVGGLVGYISDYTNITSSYSAGPVAGNAIVGGLVGQNDDPAGSITDCYWDMETSGQTDSAGGVGKSTAEMMQMATFINWDFVTIWDICEGGTYPFLRSIPAPYPASIPPVTVTINQGGAQADPADALPIVFEVAFDREVTGFDADDSDDVDVDFSGSTTTVIGYTVTDSGDGMNYTVIVTDALCNGNVVAVIPVGVCEPPYCASANLASTSTDNVVSTAFAPEVPIEINTIEELQLIGNISCYPLDGDYVLGNDIDASATAGWNGGEGFIPIAPDTDPVTGWHQGTVFTGTFDGQGYTISNLTIHRATEQFLGLFGFIVGATIQNVALENVDVSGADYVGGLVGYIYGGYNVTNCNSTGVVSGADQVGSLVGEIYDGCNVTNCYSACSVSGNVAVGGIVGFASENINITGCYSTGVVSGDVAVGGIVGTAGSFISITSCYNTGGVSGNSSVGGLVGDSESGTIITSSYSMGAASGDNCVGGLVGYADDFISIASYSTGAVSGSNYVGGLVGMVWPGYITDCYSAGAVSGDSCVGGLVGFVMNGNITNCYSVGAVSGMSVGGLVGCADFSSITDCYWDIEASGQTGSDGGTGKTTVEMMQQATFVNWDFVTVWSICEGGSYPFFEGNLTPFPIETSINVATSQADPTNTLPIVFDVVFSRPVTGFDADDGDDVDVDFSGSTTTVTGYTVVNSGDNMHYTVEVTGIDGDGVIVATIPADIIIDSCFSMSNPASTSVDNSITYDITPPVIAIGPPSQTIVTQGDYVAFTVDYTGETSSWLTENDITLDVTGDVTATVTVVSAKSDSYIVTLSNIAGIGTLGFTIAAATAIDAAGNFATAASAPVLVTAEPEVPVSAVPLAVLLLGAGVAALRMRRRNK